MNHSLLEAVRGGLVPPMEVASPVGMQTDPLAYPPIQIESTLFMDASGRLETRATSARRVPLEPDTFGVPEPAL